MSAGRFTPCVCIRPIPWRLVAAQHPPAYPEALKFHVKCNFMKFQPTDPGFHTLAHNNENVHPYRQCHHRFGTEWCLGWKQQQQLFGWNIQSSPYFDPTYTRTGWIGQPPILNRHEVVTINGDVDTLGQATP